VRILADGGRVGDFRSEQAGLEFARRLFGYVIVQQEFNFSGGGPENSRRCETEARP